jgi:hypothetical protein
MKYRSPIISFLKVSYLLQMMTLLEAFLITIAFKSFPIADWLITGNTLMKAAVLFPLLVAPFFPELDAYSRYQNYKLIKDHLFVHGFQPRILKPFIRSRCQRDAVIVAAEELGLGKECKAHFRKVGYRWYHLLPDFIFTEPATLICSSFWLNTFFAKTYTPKFDFKKIRDREENHLPVNTGATVLSRQ